MDEEEKSALMKVQLRVIEVLAYLVLGTLMILALLPFFIAPQMDAKEFAASMKDAFVNIALIVVGFVFGSSLGSQRKDQKPSDQKENA